MDILQFNSYPFLFTFILFLFMLLKIARQSKAKYNLAPNLPPGPWKLPLIGNIHQMIGSLPHRRLTTLAKKHGPLMHLRLGEIPLIVISSAEMAKEVMKTHDINFASRPFVLGPSILGYGSTDIVFSPYGDYWRQVRKICTVELLSTKRVQSFRSLREKEVSNLIESISAHAAAGSSINLTKKIYSSTSNIVSRAAVGKCQDQEELLLLIDEVVWLSSGFNVADLFPSIKLLHLISGIRGKIEKVHSKLDKILEKIIAQHKAKKDAIKSSGGDHGDDAITEDDLVDVLLKVQENGDLDFPFTMDNIKAVTLDMFIAGIETSSTTTEWAFSELLKNPRMMEKAQADVRRVFDKKGYVDEAGLDELKYLKLVVKETMRLHPPGPLLIPRECRERCEIDGYEIPVKSKVVVNAWAIGRDSKYWDDAENFNPERFNDSSIDFKGNHFQLIPFGAGRRICPGIAFGLASIELPLAQFLYHFDWKLADGKRLEELDMTEAFGATVRRKSDLLVIPIPYHPSSHE